MDYYIRYNNENLQMGANYYGSKFNILVMKIFYLFKQ